MNIQLKRVFSTFLILMIFMVTLGQSIVPLIANAEELNTTGFVDSFKIDKTTLNYGEQTQITVNFSDKSGNKMKAGDTLTLTLPQELQGFTGLIPLKNEEGTDFGTVKVTTTEVICTFTDVVENLENIRGHFYFKVMASYVATNETKTIETDLGTTLKKQSVTIIGPTEGGTSSRFFGKVGDILPNNTNEVRWALYVNSAQKYLDKDIVILDNLQSGQTLKENSFSIAINDDYISMDQIQKYGIHITFTSDTSFKVEIDKDQANGNKFLINYKANITADGKKQEAFYNNYEVDYQIWHEDPVTNKGETKVKNIDMGGEADGDLPPKGTLRIVKHIAGNEEKGIPNVLFKLYTESGQQIGDTYKTDAEGKVEVPDLKVGNYYVQEINAPDYLDFDPEAKINFTIDANAEKGVELKIPNKVKKTDVSGTKTWIDNNASDRLSIIKIDLLQNGTVVQTQDVTAANDWNYTFKDIPAYDADGNAYTYTVKEQPVAGYKSEVNGFDITNTKSGQTTVEGTKTWKDGNAEDRPSSIKVDILQNGEVIQTQEVTAANGWKYAFADLATYDTNGKAYTYEVKEQPVAGYKSEVNGYDITNTKVAQTTVGGTKTWKDDNATDRPIIKVDLLQNGQVIQTQEVTAANGWKYAFVDLATYDADGKAYTYSVKEQPVAGYKSEVNGYDITNTKV
ncbi:Cna B-type domain-containing protein, partial [Paenibacillus sp.]|uniref:Cna B-type domain-containing protein n=1 Tax=Paenibacillus sp. TaxID=58172 RepID=UPI0028AA552B